LQERDQQEPDKMYSDDEMQMEQEEMEATPSVEEWRLSSSWNPSHQSFTPVN
jgi:hypothetical protein